MADHKSKYILRIAIAALVFFAAYGVLLTGLWNEQIRRGAIHSRKVATQSIRKVRIPSIRGRIFSSDGVLLAGNDTVYDLQLHISEMRKPGRRKKTVKYILETINMVAEKIGRRHKYSAADIIHHMNYTPGLPFRVFSNLSARERAIIHEAPDIPGGVEIQPRLVRKYPETGSCCHIIGYTRRGNAKSGKDKEDFFYYIPDLTGVRGLEKAYDSFAANPKIRGLQGIPGRSMLCVDHRGYVHEKVSEDIHPINGNDITLTINFKAQKILEQQFKGKTGAAVLLDAGSGAVLGMCSSPGFNLQDFSPYVKQKKLRELYADPQRPLINRAASAAYMPGSIIKVLVALALLHNGVDPYKKVFCDGCTMIGNTGVRCASWRRGGHGAVDMIDALAYSCNDYFIESTKSLSLKQINETLASAGLGKKTNFILGGKSGLIGNSKYKKKYYKYAWNRYDTALLSIGQGIILVSPLQAAGYCAAIANGGTLFQPYLLKNIRSPQGNILYKASGQRTSKLLADADELEIVRRGMFKVVNNPHGSGRNAKSAKIVLYGKTGTAEVGTAGNKRKNTWFICFGTSKGVTYALALLIENGNSGGSSCAPVAREFFDQFID